MNVNFLGQPTAGGNQVGTVTASLLGASWAKEFTAVTAWAKVSGLERIQDAIRSFAARGGTSEIIVGIDEGGATVEGLQLALKLFDKVWVFHDPGARTFHPKLYVTRGAKNATVIVGSSNLTKGGLFTNFEASVRVDLDMRLSSTDRAFLADVDEYIKQLRTLNNNCRLLDDALLAALQADPRYQLESESSRASRLLGSTGSTASQPGLFGPAVRGLLNAPSVTTAARTRVRATDDSDDTDSVIAPASPAAGRSSATSSTTSTAAGGPMAGGATSGTPMKFWKALSAFDVNLRSAPGQIIIPIGFREFFEPLVVQIDKVSSGGVRQLQRHLPALYVDGKKRVRLPDTRAIVYEPAADHPRQNIELRFTLHNRDIAETLRKDDILVFTKDTAGNVTIERRPAGTYAGRFGWL